MKMLHCFSTKQNFAAKIYLIYKFDSTKKKKKEKESVF